MLGGWGIRLLPAAAPLGNGVFTTTSYFSHQAMQPSGGSGRPSPHESARGETQISFATIQPPMRGGGDTPKSQSGRPPPAPGSVRGGSGTGRGGSGAGTPVQTGAREQMVRTQGSGQPVGTPLSQRRPSPVAAPANERGASGGSQGGYGINFGDPLAALEPSQVNSENRRDAPATSRSNHSQMSAVSYGRSVQSGAGEEEMMPPRRTLRRMYEDPSHYQKEEFLHGLESAPATFKPEASTRNTLFHTGFYRGTVTGQDAIRKNNENDRESRSLWREEPRHTRLGDLVRVCFRPNVLSKHTLRGRICGWNELPTIIYIP